MTDPIFLRIAKEKYGSRGLKQAKEMLKKLDDGLEPMPLDEYYIYRNTMMSMWLEKQKKGATNV